MERDFIQWCSDCGQKCCRYFGSYLSERELEDLSSALGDRSFSVRLPSQGQYLDFLRLRNNHCVFLREDGRCYIQNKKPFVCRIFPLMCCWDGQRIRWFITQFCPAVGDFTERHLLAALRKAKEDVKTWSPDRIQKLVCVGLLKEIEEDFTETDLEKLLHVLRRQRVRRNETILSADKKYNHPELELEIPLDRDQWFKIDIECSSYLQGQLIAETSFMAMSIIATNLAVSVNPEDLGMEYKEWGKGWYKEYRGRIVSVDRAFDDLQTCTLDYAYVEDLLRKRGMRHIVVRDRILYIFNCEVKDEEKWEMAKKSFEEIIRNIKYISLA